MKDTIQDGGSTGTDTKARSRMNGWTQKVGPSRATCGAKKQFESFEEIENSSISSYLDILTTLIPSHFRVLDEDSVCGRL